MIFFKAFLLIISLIAIPCIPGFLGMQFFHVKEEQAFSRFLWAWLLGTLFSWALFQLVSVPLNFMRQKLSLAILLWLSLLILLSLFFFFSNKSNKKESCLQDSPRASGMRSISFLTASCASLARSAFLCNREFRRNFLLHKKKNEASGQSPKSLKTKTLSKKEYVLFEKLCLLLLLLAGFLLIGFQCYHYIFMMHTDADDSRFIASAVDAVRRDYMLLATPATGEYTVIYQDILKDAVSPWMMYIAALCKLFSIHPAIAAHTILPSYFLLMGYAIYFLIGLQLNEHSYLKALFFVDLAALILLFYGGSSHSMGSVILVRIWQGKAILAAIMIPFFFAYFIRIYQDMNNQRQIWCLLLIDQAACLLSGMGIFFAGFLIGGLGLTEMLMNRKWSHFPIYLVSCLPSVIYCVFKYSYMYS